MPTDAASAKRRQILDGARRVFAEQGYERGSVDQIAARAGVSKATVYNHFHDKQALFVAAVVGSCEEFNEGLAFRLTGTGDAPEDVLRTIGETFMARALSPSVVSLYRQAIAEAERIPEIGRAVFERGNLALQEVVAGHLRRWSDQGTLRMDDPRSAAVAFIALCQGDLVIRRRLGVLPDPVDDAIRESVARAVAIFVRAYTS
jgi:AcrR family transcriptional regulator